jgi:hypothetical protein
MASHIGPRIRLPKRRLHRILPRPIVLDQQQEQLSWNQILLDPQFSTALWCDLQKSHLRCSPSTDGKHSGMQWILSMIITIWIEVQSHWEKVRNKERHSNTKVAHLNSKFAQVLHKTEALYKLKHSTLPCDQGAYNPTSNLRLFREHNFFYFIWQFLFRWNSTVHYWASQELLEVSAAARLKS